MENEPNNTGAIKKILSSNKKRKPLRFLDVNTVTPALPTTSNRNRVIFSSQIRVVEFNKNELATIWKTVYDEQLSSQTEEKLEAPALKSPRQKNYNTRYSKGILSISVMWKNERLKTINEKMQTNENTIMAPAQPPATGHNIPRELVKVIDVINEINEFPFFGTDACCWETYNTYHWSFVLLDKHLRLRVVFSQSRGSNDVQGVARTSGLFPMDLLPKTRVSGFYVEVIRYDKSPVGRLCVRLAYEAINICARRRCSSVRDIPNVIHECATIATLTKKWGHAMKETGTHLAYKLNSDGKLTFTAVNVHLRYVWNVELRMSLESPNNGVFPWPCARDVRVTPLLAAWTPSPSSIDALVADVPRDWGHVQRTMWAVYNFLKNRRMDTDDTIVN